MLEIAKMKDGREVVQGCWLKNNGSYTYVFAVENNNILTTTAGTQRFKTPEKAKNIICKECCWYNVNILTDSTIIYPIIGQDRNDEDVRWGDMIMYDDDPTNAHKALGYIKSLCDANKDCFVIRVVNAYNDKGWGFCYKYNVVKIPEDKIEITILKNGEPIDKPISLETARTLGLVE